MPTRTPWGDTMIEPISDAMPLGAIDKGTCATALPEAMRVEVVDGDRLDNVTGGFPVATVATGLLYAAAGWYSDGPRGAAVAALVGGVLGGLYDWGLARQDR